MIGLLGWLYVFDGFRILRVVSTQISPTMNIRMTIPYLSVAAVGLLTLVNMFAKGGTEEEDELMTTILLLDSKIFGICHAWYADCLFANSVITGRLSKGQPTFNTVSTKELHYSQFLHAHGGFLFHLGYREISPQNIGALFFTAICRPSQVMLMTAAAGAYSRLLPRSNFGES